MPKYLVEKDIKLRIIVEADDANLADGKGVDLFDQMLKGLTIPEGVPALVADEMPFTRVTELPV